MRKRKNLSHKRLVSEINRIANDDDDDEEEAKMMQNLMAKHQSAVTSNMVKSQLRSIVMILLLLIMSLGLLFAMRNGEMNRTSSESGGVLGSLSKALSILVGRKKRRERPSLAGARIIAASTIAKSKIDDLLYYNTWSGMV